MNKKGFTLAELLGVIVLLGILATVAFPPLLNQLNKSKEKLSGATLKVLGTAAEQYIDDHSSSYPIKDGKTYCISLETLVNYNYLKSPIMDASTGEEISEKDNYIKFKINKFNDYDYELTTNCSEDSSIVSKDTLPNKTYTTGDAVTFGGYKWHVIGDTGTQVTLLMDANQLGDNSNMAHCTNDTDTSTDCGVDSTGTYYVYSWDKSLIRAYLNGEFLTNLESKINNEIVSTPICIDPTVADGSKTYGGYLISEISTLGSSCTLDSVSDKVRLISYSEYYNMSPYYEDESSNYPNVGHYITRISKTSDYASWLYCGSTSCGSSTIKGNSWTIDGAWWTMGSSSSSGDNYVRVARSVDFEGFLHGYISEFTLGVRPVITVVK